MKMLRLSLILIAATALSACKILILVPVGGSVTTQSGAYTCAAGQLCEIDVVDLFFDEVFIAAPKQGYVFLGWRKVDRGLCGGNIAPCHLFTSALEGHDVLLSILASDEEFALEPTFAFTDVPDIY